MPREHVARALAVADEASPAETRSRLLTDVLTTLLRDEPCLSEGEQEIVLAIRPYEVSEYAPESVVATATSRCVAPRCAEQHRGRAL